MKYGKVFTIAVLFFALLFNSSEGKAKRMVKIKSISLTVDVIAVRAGEKVKIKSNILPHNATDKEIVWISTNKKYATVNRKGIIRTKRAGVKKKVKIVAKTTDGSKLRARVHITILPFINPKKPMVALTLDDGPKSKITDSVVNTLSKNFSVSTFFVIGKNIQGDNISSLKSAARNGNEIASHTYSHIDLTTASAEKIKKEMEMTSTLIKRNTGQTVSLMRPPFGKADQRVKDIIKIPMIHWSIDTRDWSTLNDQVSYHMVMNHVKDGAIILMHDFCSPSDQAVKKIVPALIKKGYQLVTVSELLKYRKLPVEKGVYIKGIK